MYYEWSNARPVGTTSVLTGMWCIDSSGVVWECRSHPAVDRIHVGKPPVADAGDPQTVKHSQVVTLDGRRSSDPDVGTSLEFTWRQISGPSVQWLSDIHSPTPRFVPQKVIPQTELKFELTVDDRTYDRNGAGVSVTGRDNSQDTVTITVLANNPPIANAGQDQSVDEATTVTLSGASSSDPDGDKLVSFKWTQTGGDYVPNLVDPFSPYPHFVAPIVAKESTLTFQLIVNDGLVDSTPAIVHVTIKPKFKVELTAESVTINPYPDGTNRYRAGNNPPSPGSGIEVKVKHVANDQLVPDVGVMIKSCTQPGDASTDGHTHDRRAADPCYQSTRPRSSLFYKDGVTQQTLKSNPVSTYTDQNGRIYLEYVPPMTLSSIGDRYFISGIDTITASLLNDPTVKSNDIAITTKVTDLAGNNLQLMPGAHNCAGTNNYFFVPQTNHGCEFYGTADSNTALSDLANTYMQQQIACNNSPNHECEVPAGDLGNVRVRIDNIIPMRITAMSLPWGGLSDIGPGGCPTCIFWYQPHKSHNDGREIDVGLRDQQGNVLDIGHIRLLWAIINADQNWDLPVSHEGGDLQRTMQQSPENRHFHMEFEGY
jgi:hypothetical protein